MYQKIGILAELAGVHLSGALIATLKAANAQGESECRDEPDSGDSTITRRYMD